MGYEHVVAAANDGDLHQRIADSMILSGVQAIRAEDESSA